MRLLVFLLNRGISIGFDWASNILGNPRKIDGRICCTRHSVTLSNLILCSFVISAWFLLACLDSSRLLWRLISSLPDLSSTPAFSSSPDFFSNPDFSPETSEGTLSVLSWTSAFGSGFGAFASVCDCEEGGALQMLSSINCDSRSFLLRLCLLAWVLVNVLCFDLADTVSAYCAGGSVPLWRLLLFSGLSVDPSGLASTSSIASSAQDFKRGVSDFLPALDPC